LIVLILGLNCYHENFDMKPLADITIAEFLLSVNKIRLTIVADTL